MVAAGARTRQSAMGMPAAAAGQHARWFVCCCLLISSGLGSPVARNSEDVSIDVHIKDGTADSFRDDNDRSLLLIAAVEEDEAGTKALIAAGVDLNPKAGNDESQVFGTPLIAAASLGHAGVASLLIDAGADTEAKGNDADERTP